MGSGLDFGCQVHNGPKNHQRHFRTLKGQYTRPTWETTCCIAMNPQDTRDSHEIKQQKWHADVCSSMFIPVDFYDKPMVSIMVLGVASLWVLVSFALSIWGAGLKGKPLGAQTGTTNFDIHLGKTTREELQEYSQKSSNHFVFSYPLLAKTSGLWNYESSIWYIIDSRCMNN